MGSARMRRGWGDECACRAGAYLGRSLVGGMAVLLLRRIPRGSRRDAFPGAYSIIWLVLIAQNVLAQVVTGPLLGPRASWIEVSFSFFYLTLFLTSAVIIFHYQFVKVRSG